MIRKIICLAIIFSTVGCSTPKFIKTAIEIDPAKILLEDAINTSAQASPHSGSADVEAVPAKLRGNRITIKSYVNDASKLISRLAKARGIKFVITGPEPHLPLLVAVDVESVSFEELLNQIGYQFGQRADLVLGDKRIEIRYRGLE